MTNKDFLEELSKICNESECDNITQNEKAKKVGVNKSLIVVMIVLLTVSIMSVIIFADNNTSKKKVFVTFTPDPITGEVPSPLVIEPLEEPSFYEEATKALGEKTVKESDIIIRFNTYFEYATAGVSNAYHCFDVMLPQNGEYSIKIDDKTFYKMESQWSESNIVSFAPIYGMESVSSDSVILQVYKNGEQVDQICLKIEDVNVAGKEADYENGAEDIIKTIVSCESDSLKVAIYNFDMHSKEKFIP